jgi:hypothetical protein
MMISYSGDEQTKRRFVLFSIQNPISKPDFKEYLGDGGPIVSWISSQQQHPSSLSLHPAISNATTHHASIMAMPREDPADSRKTFKYILRFGEPQTAHSLIAAQISSCRTSWLVR